MCKLMEDMRNEATILGAVETLRDLAFSETEIKNRIMVKYNLTESEANNYLLKKSA
ncbi:MAG: hypothetical protein LUH23_09600 [Oscillospiraceae bacterium]|nr:hypothetical protein [Oscillospiraceae bacterium]